METFVPDLFFLKCNSIKVHLGCDYMYSLNSMHSLDEFLHQFSFLLLYFILPSLLSSFAFGSLSFVLINEVSLFFL
jgi:hypothetical protein